MPLDPELASPTTTVKVPLKVARVCTSAATAP